MTECSQCSRHLLGGPAACPFCGATQRTSTVAGWIRGVTGTAVAGMATAVLAACYGAPAGADEDNDGFNSPVDCNDLDAAVNPDATEVCDDKIDNNCDGLIDAADAACAGDDTDSDTDSGS
jgi:hypothetical protein